MIIGRNKDEDAISRTYALNQMDMAIREASSEGQREQFERFKDFLRALPSLQELEEQVRCTDCEYYACKHSHCIYSSICCPDSPEGQRPRYDRMYFSPIYKCE